MIRKALTTALLAAIATGTALAHHSYAGFAMSKPISIEGQVSKLRWSNPHVYITVENKGPDGRTRRFEIEAFGPSGLVAVGLQPEMLKPGTKVKVVVFGRVKNPDSPDHLGNTVTLPDGSTYSLQARRSATQPAREVLVAQSLEGNWAPASPVLFDFATAEAKARGATFSAPKSTAATTSCAAIANPPPPLGELVDGARTIEIGAKSVILRLDAQGGLYERVVHLQSAHPANNKATPRGHSIGRWEGQTLVIDTTAFSPIPIENYGVPQGVHKHMVERLTLTADRGQIRYEVTVEDPDHYPQPFQYSALWDHRPDGKLAGIKCDDRAARKFLSYE